MLPIVSQEISFFLALNPQSDLINVYLLVAWILKYLHTYFQDLPYVGGQLPMNIQQVMSSLSFTLLGKPLLCCNAKLEGVFATDVVISHCSPPPNTFFFFFLSISICCPLYFNLNYNKSRADDTFWLFASYLPQKAPAPSLAVPDGTVIQTIKIIS